MPTYTTHCSNCADENPTSDDGYTTCCNEPVCHGNATPGCCSAYPTEARRLRDAAILAAQSLRGYRS